MIHFTVEIVSGRSCILILQYSYAADSENNAGCIAISGTDVVITQGKSPISSNSHLSSISLPFWVEVELK